MGAKLHWLRALYTLDFKYQICIIVFTLTLCIREYAANGYCLLMSHKPVILEIWDICALSHETSEKWNVEMMN